MKKALLLVMALSLVLSLSLAGLTASQGLTFKDPLPKPKTITTFGPDGDPATWYSELKLTPEEVGKVKAMKLRAAYEMVTASEWCNANVRGFKDACKALGIEVVGMASAELDPIKQKANMESFMALNPDIVTCQPQDLELAASTFDPLYKKGIKMVYLSNVPKGYTPGKQYVSALTDSLYDMGRDAADMIAQAIGGKGEIVTVVVAGVNYVCNTRDAAFTKTIKEKYPNIKIVEEGGFQKMAEAGPVTSALLTKHPKAKGIYVSFSNPAIDVLQTVKSLGRKDIKIVTMDLDTTCSLDMAQKGNVYGIAVDLAYDMGFGRAMLGAYGALGKKAPKYVTSPSFKATRATLIEAYHRSFGIDPPKEVMEALKKK